MLGPLRVACEQLERCGQHEKMGSSALWTCKLS